MRMTATFRASRRSPLLQVLKSAVATVAAWLLAGWLLPGPLPVFAAIAALLVVRAEPEPVVLQGDRAHGRGDRGRRGGQRPGARCWATGRGSSCWRSSSRWCSPGRCG
ncbi:hypothetical protein [Microbacterium elymi]|uniref:hypothetical protein n=1 Tax=Microbacterium elymi TaxID=2909587 RepID=UPI0033906E68